MDCESNSSNNKSRNEYDELVNILAGKLRLARHSDSSITLNAAKLLLEKKQQCSSGNTETKVQKSRFTLDDITLPDTMLPRWSAALSTQPGETGDDAKIKFEEISNLNKASKVLKLLYTDDQKQLQLRVNEIISSVQAITANPKTNFKLSSVGR